MRQVLRTPCFTMAWLLITATPILFLGCGGDLAETPSPLVSEGGGEGDVVEGPTEGDSELDIDLDIATPTDTTSTLDAPDPATQRQDSTTAAQVLTSLEQLIFTDHYAGYLVIHFDEELGVRLTNAPTDQRTNELFYSLTSQDNVTNGLNATLSRYPTATIAKVVDADENEIDASREKLEWLSGESLADWNSFYHINVTDPNTALSLLRELRNHRGVSNVYPALVGQPTGLLDTPDLTNLQGYLEPESTHGGLNARAAWNWASTHPGASSIFGANVYVVDNERGLGHLHEDLSLSTADLADGGNFTGGYPDCAPGYPPFSSLYNCPAAISHGTAVAGILVGQHNSHGVSGFAPLAHFVNSTDGTLNLMTDLVDSTTRADDNIEPGSVWVIEIGIAGSPTAPPCDGTYSCLAGQLPTEVQEADFNAIRQATAYGVTVVAGAANGQVNLNDYTTYSGDSGSRRKNLYTEDAGSIMVGASQGSNKQKAIFSNYGRRVNAFAWGQGVVTTSYPYVPSGWAGYPPDGPYSWWESVSPRPAGLRNDPILDLNNYYTNNFGGTSSATAMVGGAVALIQSHARAVLGGKRYIMPLKMREIITRNGVTFGVPALDTCTRPCNIGTQPMIDAALAEVDRFIDTMRTAHPKLVTGETMTDAEMLALRSDGIGIVCNEFNDRHQDSTFIYPLARNPRDNDPSCPDSQVFPVGHRLAKDLDFDGDGRADLVQWTNGSWKLDLSTVGTGGDNYGAWDVTITHTPIATTSGQDAWPYAIDMNRDGRTDFVMYDKEHGIWYVKFTTTNLLRGGAWGTSWDWTIDYHLVWQDELTLDPFGTDPSIPDTKYSRPVPGDYNNDGWIDIAIACSDGNWRIDNGRHEDRIEGGRTFTVALPPDGTFDRTVRYLSDSQLAAAPGWAYLGFTLHMRDWYPSMLAICYKIPDTLSLGGRIVCRYPMEGDSTRPIAHFVANGFGGNDSIPSMGWLLSTSISTNTPAIKDSSGNWRVAARDSSTGMYNFIDFPPLNVFGGNECHPVVTDFDGDHPAGDGRRYLDDRAVMCPDGWRIAYSSPTRFAMDPDGARRIPLTYNTSTFSLPGRSYAGGISYSYSRELIEMFQRLNPGVPPPIPVDMVTFY